MLLLSNSSRDQLHSLDEYYKHEPLEEIIYVFLKSKVGTERVIEYSLPPGKEMFRSLFQIMIYFIQRLQLIRLIIIFTYK